ncbi:MAG: type II secretion system protein, partial [Myxococcota bacterium]
MTPHASIIKKTLLDRRRRRKGLTLVEIMVVIAILGVLMAVLGGSMLDLAHGQLGGVDVGAVE